MLTANLVIPELLKNSSFKLTEQLWLEKNWGVERIKVWKTYPNSNKEDLTFQRRTQMGGSWGVLIEMLSFCIIFSYRILKSLAEGKAHTTGK